ncbi:hypothetical protein MTAT_20380 [Moorella thermoacetica]|uniref:Calcineurin-like phosphoesterase domain-containing protein n=1 Tax=Neomoorella thermoacetica TaxID=1525 RepID=A0AAC9HJ38_NEOTH|nr:hypothetical protein [Moorella thermoacetica]AOQ24693.1 hypothetical protein Maut_02265 [Moorella thermoacetica]TYL12796.1 hypothetical protein MTAT_20380 [Moorella thermoacetica]
MTINERLQQILENLGYQAGNSVSPLLQERARTDPEQKQVYVHNLKPASGVVRLIPLGDIHLGLKSSRLDVFKRFLDYLLANDCYTICLGDQVENATRTSVGLGMYEEDFHLQDQLDAMALLLEPVAKAGKLLGIHEGNHEHRAAVAAGLHPMRILADRLQVPYLGYQGYHKFIVGKEIYHVFTAHNRGGGRTVAGKIKAAEDADQIAFCDVYITGHSHIIDHHYKPIFYIDDATNTLCCRLRHYVICGSFLSYWGSYAEMQLLPPAAIGAPEIIFSADKHLVQVIT